jgi:predicted nuclease of predicted toxin-antitoxin system
VVSYYFDEMMSWIPAKALQQQGIQVVMATDVGMIDKDDDIEHLVYATEHQLVLVTMDKPFAGRTMQRTDHAGLICWTGKLNDFGAQVKVLAQFATNHKMDEVQGQVFWLK